MLKILPGKHLGYFQGRVHIAKGGGEDQVIAALGQIPDHPLCLLPLGNALDKFCLHLVTKVFFHLKTSLVMLIRPAGISDGRDVDKTDLQLVCRDCGHGKGSKTGKTDQ